MSNAASPLGALAQMRHSFADLQAGRLGIPAFSEAARSHPALLQVDPQEPNAAKRAHVAEFCRAVLPPASGVGS